ncbi:Sialic acid-binding Ig-like lectin 8 [Myotis brandtii]|uniref:Sialic acid-binding Ig-like lectin 8 n=1 Tax=Myotis brandtii TaxID=109478 RepID=S7N9K1_MYOBR|nr:Sialic acid-binding Ig-like lectin 8 [Myotis brandtii]
MPSEMLRLLLPLLWAGSLAQKKGYTLKVQTPMTVQEGLCVQVACNVSYAKDGWTDSTPAHGYWYKGESDASDKVLVATNNPNHKVQEETQGRFHLLGDPRTNNCSLDIRDARRTDNGIYFFRVERGNSAIYSYTMYKLTVQVTALNHTPDILNLGILESGRPRSLTCSVPWACERGTPPIFSWTSAAHTSLGPRTRLSSVLTLTPRPQDHGTNLTCQVHFPAVGVTVERTIQLNVTSPTVPENGSSLLVPEGQSLRLVCVGNSNPPARLSWAKGNLNLSSSRPGVLELPPVQAGDEGELTESRGIIIIIMLIIGSDAGGSRGCRCDHPALPGLLCRLYHGSLNKSQPDSRLEHLPPPLAVPSSGKKEEIQYATLKFHKIKPGSPQEQEGGTENEYSEILM